MDKDIVEVTLVILLGSIVSFVPVVTALAVVAGVVVQRRATRSGLFPKGPATSFFDLLWARPRTILAPTLRLFGWYMLWFVLFLAADGAVLWFVAS